MQEIITDSKTNSVCFSSLLSKFKLWKDMERILNEKNIKYSFINGTKDIWVRDFMPIEMTEGHFLKFSYHPTYLKNLKEYRTDWPDKSKISIRSMIDDRHYIKQIRFPDSFLNINLDGGNVIKCDDCIVISDRIFKENRRMKKVEILDSLENAFGQEVVIIPADPEEKTGHADGMIRYIGNNTVLLNHYVDFDRELRDRLIRSLSPRFTVAELHYGTNSCPGTNWAYLNYLQIGGHVIVPLVNDKLDNIAIPQLQDILNTHIDVVPAFGAVRIGGGLNCLSWTTRSVITNVEYDEFIGCI